LIEICTQILNKGINVAVDLFDARLVQIAAALGYLVDGMLRGRGAGDVIGKKSFVCRRSLSR
jgi:hypothetical protein